MGVYVALSTMDKWWYDGIGREEGVDVLKKCVNECEKRMSPYLPLKITIDI
jgi:20S proteasome subunit beta 4